MDMGRKIAIVRIPYLVKEVIINIGVRHIPNFKITKYGIQRIAFKLCNLFGV